MIDVSTLRGRIALLALLFLCLAGAFTGSASAQSTPDRPLSGLSEPLPGALRHPVTASFESRPLSAVLREIARQSGLAISFATDRIDSGPAVTFSFDALPARDAILRVLDGRALSASLVRDDHVVIHDARRTEPVHRPPPGQALRGRVVDALTRSPLPGANVVVRGTDPLIGASTDIEGRFVIEGVPLGRHTIQASFIGYEPVVMADVVVTSGRETTLTIELREDVVYGAEVTVTPRMQRGKASSDIAVVSARSFTVEDTRRYAGGVDDPARMASAFAGVMASRPEENALVVRGNAPRSILWRLEGLEIPNPSHFGGMQVAGGGGLTLFSSQMLADSDFFTGAFPAEYGNVLAGVFDMRFRSGNNARREYAFQVGALGIEAGAEGPFAMGKPSSYLVNYRYSMLGLIMPLLPVDGAIRYQDLAFKLAFPTTRAGRFEVWGLGGLDYQRANASQDPAGWRSEFDRSTFELDLGVGAAGISHSLILGRRTLLETRLGTSANSAAVGQRLLSPELVLHDDYAMDNLTGRAVVSTRLSHRFGPAHTSRTGISLQHLFYDLNIRAARQAGAPMDPVVAASGTGRLLQGFSQSRVDVTPSLTLTAGVHAQWFSLTDALSIEPRGGLEWRPARDHSLSLGYGRHSQVEDLRIYEVGGAFPRTTSALSSVHSADAPGSPNRRLDVAKADHLVAGYELRSGTQHRFRLEGYYQRLFDVPVVADSSFSMINFEQDWRFNDALVNDGAGENYGVELTAERFMHNGFYYLLTGSVFRSRYAGGDGVWRPTRYDRRFMADALAGREFPVGRNLLGINARLSVGGGERRSPIDGEASRGAGGVVFDERRAFEVQESPAPYLDATVTYRINRRRFSEVWALQVKNVLGASYSYPYFDFVAQNVEMARETFVLPQISWKIEF
jgi:hypothetical protein